MEAKTGSKWALADGGMFLVTIGRKGILTDGDTELLPAGTPYDREPVRQNAKALQLGKRWAIISRQTEKQGDGKDKVIENVEFEGLIILPGGTREVVGDLRLDGVELELKTPKVLPSAD